MAALTMRCSGKTRRALALSIGLLSLAAWAGAQDPPGGPAPASAAPDAGAAGPPAPVDPRLAAARTLEQNLRALTEGELNVEVAPESLFDVPLDDAAAVEVEARRLRALLGALPQEAPAPPASLGDELYGARLAVDRARLGFLQLSPDERRARLEAHATRRAQADAERPELAAQREARLRAEREADEVAAERERVVRQMEAAQSEASRAIARERATLLGVREAQSKFEVTLHEREQLRAARSERALGLRRRVEELRGAEQRDDGEEASALYDTVRDELRVARRELGAALDEAGRATSDVPRPGPDPLGELAAGAADLQQLRSELRTRAGELAAAEREARWSQVRHLHEVVLALNRDRHSLYAYLPGDHRAELSGFGSAGRDQAAGELRQLAVVTRYHVANLRRLVSGGTWLASVREALLSLQGLEVIALGALFVAWRRGSRRKVAEWAAMSPVPSTVLGARLEPFRERFIAVITRIHRPLELLVFLWMVRWIIGPEIAGQLAFHIGWVIASWSLGGLVAVNAADGLVAPRRGEAQLEAESQLRLRTLQLIGRLAVGVGLVLDLSAAFVLRGTLYGWVLRITWLALLPLALLLVRWWQPTIAQRCAARAKQSSIARWVAERTSGPAASAAAAVGGAYLLAEGAAAMARSQMAAFDATRRILAYLFRREVLRKASAIGPELRPLEPALRAVFDPDAPPAEAAAGEGNEATQRALDERLASGTGGIVALVGERGSGKSVLARRAVQAQPPAMVLHCPPGGVSALRDELLAALGLPADAPDSALIARLTAPEEHGAAAVPTTIVIDDAQRLVLPAVGGLDAFDALLVLARAASARCTWIFCFGAVMWQFIEKARGAYPLFDEVLRLRPWTEQNIGALLRSRCAAAGIEPSFRSLAHDEADADQAQRARQNEADYYRLLWDASGGNPGIALHLWREALRVAPDGSVIVTLFSQPDPRDLQHLSADMAFVLRAVLRLERVGAEQIARSTLLPLPAVNEALHSAERRGWLEQRERGYRVTWAWLRALTLFLQRRRMLLGWDYGGKPT